MKKYLLLALMFFVLSCNSKLKVEKHNDDAIVKVSHEDNEMNKIIENARKTKSIFIEALQNPKPDERGFTLKFPFTTDPGSKNEIEHIWLKNIKNIKENQYSGVVANDPFFIKKMKFGQTVEFDINKISDWMYFKGNKIIGGKSVKYLIENIAEKDRDEESKMLLKMFD